jgi:hypothetical protein
MYWFITASEPLMIVRLYVIAHCKSYKQPALKWWRQDGVGFGYLLWRSRSSCLGWGMLSSSKSKRLQFTFYKRNVSEVFPKEIQKLLALGGMKYSITLSVTVSVYLVIKLVVLKLHFSPLIGLLGEEMSMTHSE